MDCTCGEKWCDARNLCSVALVRNRRHFKGGDVWRAAAYGGPEVDARISAADWTPCGADDCEICESYANDRRNREQRQLNLERLNQERLERERLERQQIMDRLRESIGSYPSSIWLGADGRRIR